MKMRQKKIYAAKGRPSDNLIIHITNMKALDKIVSRVPEKAVKVAEKYWPGPLTMIFNKSDIVPYGTTGGLDTVAVRMPVDEIIKRSNRCGWRLYRRTKCQYVGKTKPDDCTACGRGSDGQSGYDRRRWCCGDWRGINDTGCDSRAADDLKTRSDHKRNVRRSTSICFLYYQDFFSRFICDVYESVLQDDER